LYYSLLVSFYLYFLSIRSFNNCFLLAVSVGTRRDFSEGLSHGLGVEGCGHWSLGGIKPGRFSGLAVPQDSSRAAPSAAST